VVKNTTSCLLPFICLILIFVFYNKLFCINVFGSHANKRVFAGRRSPNDISSLKNLDIYLYVCQEYSLKQWSSGKTKFLSCQKFSV
jgi:hypothetical protein